MTLRCTSFEIITWFLFRKCYRSSFCEVSRSGWNGGRAGAKPLNCGAPPSEVGHAEQPFRNLWPGSTLVDAGLVERDCDGKGIPLCLRSTHVDCDWSWRLLSDRDEEMRCWGGGNMLWHPSPGGSLQWRSSRWWCSGRAASASPRSLFSLCPATSWRSTTLPLRTFIERWDLRHPAQFSSCFKYWQLFTLLQVWAWSRIWLEATWKIWIALKTDLPSDDKLQTDMGRKLESSSSPHMVLL